MNETTVKTKKPQGIIRTGAVVPFIVFVAIVWVYFFFFFDTHLKHALQYAATHINGAEVDIAKVHTSFWNASLEIDQIQVTSATEPTRNKVQVGRMHWKMLWDALLRGKVVIDDASINEISIGVPRAHAGYVLPPPPPPKPSDKPSAAVQMEHDALQRTQDEFKGNVLGDAASLLSGTDPTKQLKNVEGSLKSTAKIKELQTELAGKQKEWNDRIAKLPQQKDLNALQDRVKAVKLDHFSNPGEVQQSLSQLDSIYKDANAKIQEVQSTQTALNGDLANYQNALQGLQGMVAQDIKDLEDRIKLPKLDVATLSRTIFGPVVFAKIEQARFYINKAREYMPAKKSGSDEKAKTTALQPHEREKGRNYSFGKPHSYPLFWLKKADVSSKQTPGADYSGNLEGKIENVASDQELTGLPTTAEFKGDFPKQEIFGANAKLTIDHRTDTAIESLKLHVDKLSVPDRQLVDSPEVKLGMTHAIATTDVDAEFSGDNIKVASQNSIVSGASGPFLTSSANQPILADILKNALASVPKVTVEAKIDGQWTSPKFDIDSNLGRDLASAFEKQLQAKVAEARAKIQNLVNDQIGKQKEALNAQFNQVKGQVDGLLKQKQDEVKKTEGSIDQAKNDAVKNQTKQLQNQGGKAVDDLKKRLGF